MYNCTCSQVTMLLCHYDNTPCCNDSTVEPPIKDLLRSGHNKNNLSAKDTIKCSFSHIVNTF